MSLFIAGQASPTGGEFARGKKSRIRCLGTVCHHRRSGVVARARGPTDVDRLSS